MLEELLAAIKLHRVAIKFVSKELRERDTDIAAEEFKVDKELVIGCIRRHGSEQLRGASPELKRDKEIVLAAVLQSGEALQYASEELKRDKEIVLTAVLQNGEALQYASEELKRDKEVVLTAVKQNGEALQYASEELRQDKGVVRTAMNQDDTAIEYATPALQREIQQEDAYKPQNESSLCIICIKESPTHAFIPCGHVCVCKRCSNQFYKQENKKCPICREPFNSITRIFLI